MGLGIGIYVLIYLVSPVEVLVPMEVDSFVFMAITIIALILGSRSADHLRLQARPRLTDPVRLMQLENRLFWSMLSLGLLGNLLRLADKYIMRGVGDVTGLDAREMLLETSGTMLSLIGGVLYPFGYLPIFILLGAKVLPRTRWRMGLASFIFLIPAVEAIVLFSRSFMLVSLAMGYFGAALTLFDGKALPRKLFLPLLVAVTVILSLSMVVFSWRLDQMSFDISDSIFMSGYAHTLAPNDKVQAIIFGDSTFSGLVTTILPILQYYVHAVFEFQILWSVQDTQTFANGALLFAPYVKLLAVFGIGTQADLFELFPRVGVFTTFWGPLWVDFGWMSTVVMFFFGFMARMTARASRARDVGAIPLYTYFCVILFFMPVVNFAISAQGMYVLNAFALFWFLSRRVANRAPA